jgi:hypothetical protein
MMKFFRKHNKHLLALFMVMLMVVFIGGSALEGMLMPDFNRVVAQSRLGTIDTIEQQRANATTRILQSIGYDWTNPVGVSSQPLETIDWILLTREAKKLGTGVDETVVRSTMPPENIIDLARQLRIKPAELVGAIKELKSIQNTALAVANAATLSEAEIQAAARNILEKVSIHALMLSAEAFVDETWEFSEAEIAEQFETYRDKEPGGGLDFGYYQQPAIKVQFIEVDRNKIAESIKVPNIDKLAKDYFEQNREREFRRPREEIEAAKNLEGPAPDPYLTWDEAKDKAKELVRKKQADAAAERMADWLIRHASEAWLSIERDPETRYKAAPEAVKSLDYYNQMVGKVPPNVAYPEAVREWRSNYFTVEKADDVSLIGATFFVPEHGAPIPFRRLVAQNEFLVPKVPDDPGLNTAEYLALFETCPYPVKNRLSGSMYVFRVVEGRKGRPAESIDEVRDEIIADLRLKKAYGIAKGRAQAVLACDPESPLKELMEADPELVSLKDEGVTYAEPTPFGRTPSYMRAQDRPESVLVFGGVGELPSAVVDELFRMEYAGEKRAMFELPDRATVMVAEWKNTERPDDLAYLDLREALERELEERRWAEVLRDWLEPENVRARNEFKLALE